MLGWPNHPIGGGRPPRLAWGGSATPKPTSFGAAEPPPVAQGVVRPLGPKAQKRSLGGFDDNDGGDREILMTTKMVARAQSLMLMRAQCLKASGGCLRGEIFSRFEASQIRGITSLQPIAALWDLQTRCLRRPLDSRSLDCRTAETSKSLRPPVPQITVPPKTNRLAPQIAGDQGAKLPLGPGQTGWPTIPHGVVSATPAYFPSLFFLGFWIFFSKKKKKKVMGAF
jgi:hypothetical protein